MNSHTDWFKPGVFAVKDPAGVVLLETFASTPHSARAEFVRKYNKRWSAAAEAGYTLAEFEQVATVLPPDAPQAD